MLQVHFQLRHLLGVGKRIPKSLLKDVATHTGLREHQVRDMLYETKKGISFQNLGQIIYYLVHHRGFDRRTVLNELFVTAPESFWSMLAYRGRIDLCIGARQDPQHFNQYVVIAADAELQASLVSGITGMRRVYDSDPADGPDDAGWEEPSAGEFMPPDGEFSPRAQVLNPLLVPSPPPGLPVDAQVRAAAEEVYRSFTAGAKDRALVCLGSVKSNPVIELLVADCFADARPFESQDDVAAPADRSVPFMFRYRERRDPQPASCCGGMALAAGAPAAEPGIYFEGGDGVWKCAPHRDQEDAALVFYRYEVASGRLDVALGGFSSQATRALAAFVRNGAARLWPPSFKNERLVVGAFVLHFRFLAAGALQPANPLAFVPPRDQDITIERLDEAVIARRLSPAWLEAERRPTRRDEEKSPVPVGAAVPRGKRGRRSGRIPPPSQPR